MLKFSIKRAGGHKLNYFFIIFLYVTSSDVMRKAKKRS